MLKHAHRRRDFRDAQLDPWLDLPGRRKRGGRLAGARQWAHDQVHRCELLHKALRLLAPERIETGVEFAIPAGGGAAVPH